MMAMRFLRYFTPVVLMFGLFIAPHRSASLQPATDAVCPTLVQEALQELETNCSGLGRNIACYGYNRIGATFTQEVEAGYFSRPADRADLVSLQSISTAPMDIVNNEWGVALLNAQANLPGSLPGQSVTFILLGDATVVNAVPADEAALPVDPVTVIAASETPLRSFATSTSNVLGMVPSGAALGADAISQDGSWARVVYEQSGGWVRIDVLENADLSTLPVVTDETYTPMQAFVFRTGIQQPACSEAPNSVVIQGPTNTQVNLNVNGADIVVGSTVSMSSVQGAPSDILENLDLPDEIEDQLNGGSDGGSTPDGQECALMQLSVVSGEALLNEGEFVLPEGNAAWSVYCGEPGETLPNDTDLEATEEPGGEQPPENVSFASNWGAFRPLNQDELQGLGVLEDLPPQVLNYEIDVPEEDEITPAYQNTATATNTVIAPVFVSTSTPSPTLTPTLEPTFTSTSPPPPPATPTIRPGEGVPATITASAGTLQSTMVGTAFTVGLQARVTDAYGSGVANVNVTFAAPIDGATGSFDGTVTVTTNALGYANAPAFTANTIAGSYAVTASTDALVANFDLTNIPGTPASIIAFAGTPQSAQVAAAFAAPLQARILDQYSNGVPGVSVTFAAPTSGVSGSFASTGSPTETVVTDALGIATTSVFTANTAVGSYILTAGAGALSVGFNLTNAPGSPASITPTAGTPQSTLIGTTFATPLQIRVLDAYANPVAGAPVTFSAPDQASTASGTFGGSSTVATDASGLSTAPALTANSIAGSYVVTATVGTLTVNFDLTNTNPVPSTSELSQSSATAGDAGFTLTINGAGFTSGAVVTWTDQSDLMPTGNTGTAITVDIPASYLAVPGTFSIGVTNPAPGGGASNAQTFTVVAGTVVTTLNDSGPGSLRDVIAAAPAGSTITFAVTGTITLSSPIPIDKNLTIQGPGAGSLTVSGSGSTRIFTLTGGAGVDVTLAGFHMDRGGGGAGGGTIGSDVRLTLNNVWISGSVGSGLYTQEGGGSVTILNSTFSGNTDTVDMGGAFHANVNFTVVNSTFQGNGGTWGAFSARLGTVTVINSTFADNVGSMGGIENQVFGSAVVLTNVILHNTTCGGAFTDGTGNHVSAGSCTGITPAATGDPLLQALGFNGGGTPTMALGAGSPALNAANGSVCTSSPVNSLDQRGVGRGDPCDIGAYEG